MPQIIRGGRANSAGARALFYLCNFAYTQLNLFENVDTTVMLSRYHADWYREHVGIDGVPIYPVLPPQRILCEPQSLPTEPERKYVTFVNPQPHKGVFLVAKLAEVLARERPDIPLLVVEGRASTDWLNRTGADLASANLFRMKNTPDPRAYLQATHIMLVPSVWRESFGRVAAEAMISGIPVIGSTRGALPEVIGEAGVLLDIPERITPDSRELPTDEEVLPWKQAIERLWDDPEYYAEIAKRAKSRAELWSVDSIIAEFEKL